MMKRSEPNQGKLLPNVEGEPNFYEIEKTHPLPPPTAMLMPGYAPQPPYPGYGGHPGYPPYGSPLGHDPYAEYDPYAGYPPYGGPPPHYDPYAGYPPPYPPHGGYYPPPPGHGGPYDAPPGYSPNPYEREGYPQQQPSAGENDGDGFSPSAQHPAADAEGGEGKEDDLPPAMHPRNEDDDIDVDDADRST
jgi:hypothetical protein